MDVRVSRPFVLLLAMVVAPAAAAWSGTAAGAPAVIAAVPSQEPSAVARGASLRGVLTDQSGAVVPRARIELTNIGSNSVRSTVSNHLGRYAFASLPAGDYLLMATSSGFEPAVRDRLRIADGADAVADLVLRLARQEAVVVVTAPALSNPLTIRTDARAPRQPIPAHDGADYLKTVPGFSIVRKGGTDGDPVLRGMAGSRLGVLLDGQQILGGCGGRMDPPTAYVFPSAYNRITVLKGPQTVLYGAGSSAGVVLFEREMKRVERPGVRIQSSLTAGAFGRHDEMADVRAGMASFYVQGTGTRSHTGDYKDGRGAPVHSQYTRWSGNTAFGWTPDDTTLLEASAAMSNGRAAFADRSMDASAFARENVALKFDKRFRTAVLQRIEAQSYYNYIDHVMDNFSLRAPATSFAVMNPDRRTMGGRVAGTFAVRTAMTLVVGADVQHNVHTGRSVMGAASASRATSAVQAAARVEDMRFRQLGLFTEGTGVLGRSSRVVAGGRSDWHEARDSRACVGAAMCAGASPFRNTTQGLTDRRRLPSGFVRYEHDLVVGGASASVYAGVGHVQRFADFWERSKQDPVTLKSAFLSVRPERTTQLDTGLLVRSRAWSGSLSLFSGTVRDYLLIRWQPTPAVVRNVNATSMGGEAQVSINAARNLKVDASVAYVRAANSTDGKPLAQQPPLETRMGLTYDTRTYSIGSLVRLVGSQRRVDVGSGNIVSNGMDIGPTNGFAVFSLNGGYRLAKGVRITAGIDNLFNRLYAEHISQGGAAVPGFVPTTRVNEPGRTAWVTAQIGID